MCTKGDKIFNKEKSPIGERDEGKKDERIRWVRMMNDENDGAREGLIATF